jgi:hypothetical protein
MITDLVVYQLNWHLQCLVVDPGLLLWLFEAAVEVMLLAVQKLVFFGRKSGISLKSLK